MRLSRPLVSIYCAGLLRSLGVGLLGVILSVSFPRRREHDKYRSCDRGRFAGSVRGDSVGDMGWVSVLVVAELWSHSSSQLLAASHWPFFLRIQSC